MLLLNFDLLWKNYGTMEKTIMVLYRELWNFDLPLKKKVDYQKTMKLWFIIEKYGNIQKQLKF